MEKEIREAIETRHNVWLSEDGELYKVCAGDPDADPYGWSPVPDEWVREAEEAK